MPLLFMLNEGMPNVQLVAHDDSLKALPPGVDIREPEITFLAAVALKDIEEGKEVRAPRLFPCGDLLSGSSCVSTAREGIAFPRQAAVTPRRTRPWRRGLRSRRDSPLQTNST